MLHDLGVAVLSRDLFAGTAGVPGLWRFRWRGTGSASGERLVDQDAGELLAATAGGQGPVGVMLHHEVMSDHDRADLGALLASPVIGCPNL